MGPSRRHDSSGFSVTKVVALTAAAALLFSGTASSSLPAPSNGPAAGAPGIGDPYFPKYGNGGYQVQRYDIDVEYFNDSRRLQGNTLVTAHATETLDRFNLDLLLPTSSVRVNGQPADFDQARHELIVTPSRPIRKGRRFRVRVKYAGKPGSIRYGGEKPFAALDSGAVAVGQPNIAPWWFPSNDHPSDKARFAVNLNVTKGQQAISNGRLAGKSTTHGRTTWRWRPRDPMATYLAFAVWGDYTIERGLTRSGLPYLYAFDERLGPKVARVARRTLRTTGRVTDFMVRRWGRYPFGSVGGVAVASPRNFGTLENQTRTLYHRWSFSQGFSPELVAHEATHSWFGDAVTLNRWRGMWLNEGYAVYSGWWMWAAKHGGRTLDKQFDHAYRTAGGHDFWSVPIGDPGPDHLFDWSVYLRGAMTLHALRRKIGSKDFFTLSRRWVHGNADGVGSQREYRRLAEKVSGADLGPFFRKWLGSGKPKL